MRKSKQTLFAFFFLGVNFFSYGQHHHAQLHVDSKWKSCSFQIDPSLTQQAFHQFTKEAGLAAYFRPLTDAKPMGKWNFEISLLEWRTKIDDANDAWNNTFVHPDSAHWLKESDRLGIPGLTGRIGITDKMDVAIYWTTSPGANYGFYGGQIQYNIINNLDKSWAASARMNFNSMYGPKDLNLTVYGIDLLASKEFKVYSNWAFISPYAGVSTYLSRVHEKTNKVDLKDENILGAQAMLGITAKLSHARLGMEYNFAKVSTLSFKIGIGF